MPDYTPGPWSAGHFSSVVGVPITAQPDPDKNTIVVASTRGGAATTPEGFRAEAEANARIMAAAPKMLAALESLVAMRRDELDNEPEDWSTGGYSDERWREARQAIAEAKGNRR